MVTVRDVMAARLREHVYAYALNPYLTKPVVARNLEEFARLGLDLTCDLGEVDSHRIRLQALVRASNPEASGPELYRIHEKVAEAYSQALNYLTENRRHLCDR